jgi:hypothetical protein
MADATAAVGQRFCWCVARQPREIEPQPLDLAFFVRFVVQKA